MSYQVYLCGAMERRADHGIPWRADVAAKLRSQGVQVHSPTERQGEKLVPHGFATDDEMRAAKTGDLPRYTACFRDIIDFDLDAVEEGDAVLVYVCRTMLAYSGGSGTEMTYAYRMGIPVYAVLEEGLTLPEVPGWLLGTVTAWLPDFNSAVTAIRDQASKKVEASTFKAFLRRQWPAFLRRQWPALGFAALFLYLEIYLRGCA